MTLSVEDLSDSPPIIIDTPEHIIFDVNLGDTREIYGFPLVSTRQPGEASILGIFCCINSSDRRIKYLRHFETVSADQYGKQKPTYVAKDFITIYKILQRINAECPRVETHMIDFSTREICTHEKMEKILELAREEKITPYEFTSTP